MSDDKATAASAVQESALETATTTATTGAGTPATTTEGNENQAQESAGEASGTDEAARTEASQVNGGTAAPATSIPLRRVGVTLSESVIYTAADEDHSHGIKAGDKLAAVIVKLNASTVNLHVLASDSSQVLFKANVRHGEGPGQWHF